VGFDRRIINKNNGTSTTQPKNADVAVFQFKAESNHIMKNIPGKKRALSHPTNFSSARRRILI
jgi:hypothetical protein